MATKTKATNSSLSRGASSLVSLSDVDWDDRTHRLRLELDSEGLKKSLADQGQLVPVILRRVSAAARLQVVCGFRRLAAIKALGWTNVDAVVVSGISDADAFDMAVVENAQRQDFTDLDRGNAVLVYRQRFGRRLEDIAQLMGLQRRQVARLEQLTTLPTYVQFALSYGGVPTTHVLVLVDHFDPTTQELAVRRWLTRLRDTRMSVVSLRQELQVELGADRSKSDTGRDARGWYTAEGLTIRLRPTTFQLDVMPVDERERLAQELESLAMRLRDASPAT